MLMASESLLEPCARHSNYDLSWKTIMHTMHSTSKEDSNPAVSHYHAVVWLDHHEARIIHFPMVAAEGAEENEEVVRSLEAPHHLHIKAGSASGTHITEQPAFYREVARACEGAHAVLLDGPSTARTEFLTYIKKHSPQTAACIAGVEASSKMTEHQLLALGGVFSAKRID
jgi:hypothetical protein